MISYIKGTISEIEQDKIVIECNNMGFNIFVTNNIISESRLGEEIQIYTYMSVKEDGITLFGFKTKDELNIFKKMITVSGIGPKGAISILSTLNVSKLRIAIMSDDAKAISKAPGIGAKTASKLILELKDKIAPEAITPDRITSDAVEAKSDADEVAAFGDAVDALCALGYSSSQSYQAVKNAMAVCGAEDVSRIIKLALKEIG